MSTEVKLPRLGQGMESGIIGKWLKSEGDRVEKGEPLYEVETDKATQEVEAELSGVLLKIAVSEGEVPVGQTIAVIGEAGEDVPAAKEPPAAAAEPAAAPAEKAPKKQQEPVAVAAPAEGDRIKASPLARRMAREQGIELAGLTGTGPDGRIVAEDVEGGAAATPSAPAPGAPVPAGDVESVPLTKLRGTIARRLTAAWEVPVFVLTVSVDMGPANSLIERARELNPDVRVTVTDLLAKVCAQALQRHPDVNVQFTEDAILRMPSANIGIAVAAPQGLVVPVIRSVERRSPRRRSAAPS